MHSVSFQCPNHLMKHAVEFFPLFYDSFLYYLFLRTRISTFTVLFLLKVLQGSVYLSWLLFLKLPGYRKRQLLNFVCIILAVLSPLHHQLPLLAFLFFSQPHLLFRFLPFTLHMGQMCACNSYPLHFPNLTYTMYCHPVFKQCYNEIMHQKVVLFSY